MTTPDPGELPAQIARFRELRERGERVQAELAATSATVAGAGGAVTVTVGAGGVLRGVEFGEPARKLPLERLAAEIMRSYGAAARAAADQSVAIMSTLVGPDSPTLALMRAAVPPEAEPDEEGPPR